MRKNNGFTLIELLVIISIIGLLSVLAIVSLNTARMSARDARRKSDLKQIQKALEMYYDIKGYYPPSGIDNRTYCAYDLDQYGIAWSLTAETGLMGAIPKDPLTPNGTCYDNCYFYRGDVSIDPAGQSKGYALVTLLEKPTAADLATQRAHFDSGNQCDPNRDWAANGYALYGGIWP
jgi:prepilin-type N-terminal cleavage/methylation domain-containing protein